MAEVILKQEQLTEMFTLQKQLLDTVEENDKQNRSRDETVTSKFDKINGRLDEIELAGQRAHSAQGTKHAIEQVVKDFNPERKAAFDTYLRKGSVGPDQVKLLSEGDATTGGFFVVPEYLNEIIKAIILISPVRQFAKIRPTASDSVKVPKRSGTPTAYWTAEGALQNNTQSSYALDSVPNHEMTAVSRITMADLEDSMFDMSAQINSDLAEQFAKLEGAGFVNGTGKGQPEGFMTNSAIPYTPTGQASTLSAQGDEFVNAAHAIKSGYVPDLTWFLNRQTIGKVRLMKDSQNRPIWLPFAQAGLSGSNAPTIVGLPYAEMPDMPNVGAGLYPVAIGAWSKCYLIVDRLSITMLRDPYTESANGIIRFLARKRVGGQVVLVEGINKIKVATS